MNTKIIGVIILVIIIAAAVGFKQFSGNGALSNLIDTPKEQVIIKGFVSGEKIGFVENEEVKKYLKKKYGITIDYTKAGSIDMAKNPVSQSMDFIWPASDIAVDIYKSNPKNKILKSDIIFNSPIVFYSWDKVVTALVQKGYVEQVGGVYYMSNFPGFLDLITNKKKWAEIGLPELYDGINIATTDPNYSNSGAMFAGMIADIFNGGDVVDETTVDKVLPKVQDYFRRQGYQEQSSGDIFNQYLKTGIGAKPIIVAYENQALEFSLANPTVWPTAKQSVRIVYPKPTVWSTHPLVAITAKGSKLIEAMKDPEIQKLAWEKSGFRSGLIGVQNDPKALQVVGAPERIEQVEPIPNGRVMEKIIDSLK